MSLQMKKLSIDFLTHLFKMPTRANLENYIYTIYKILNLKNIEINLRELKPRIPRNKVISVSSRLKKSITAKLTQVH